MTNLNVVKRKLKSGEIAELAVRTGFSRSHVSNVLAGRRSNKQIVNAAEKLTKRRK